MNKEATFDVWMELRGMIQTHMDRTQAQAVCKELSLEGVHPRLVEAVQAVLDGSREAMVAWFEKWEPRLTSEPKYSQHPWWSVAARAVGPSFHQFVKDQASILPREVASTPKVEAPEPQKETVNGEQATG